MQNEYPVVADPGQHLVRFDDHHVATVSDGGVLYFTDRTNGPLGQTARRRFERGVLPLARALVGKYTPKVIDLDR
jgi:hypothetical protein